ncbi:hypothetical protein BD779DRAFT_1677921 [Infundibulicybe gibba]|nr:hypothetical protein BD779DRAFT_1677921 [Infundibulicybe gibba]
MLHSDAQAFSAISFDYVIIGGGAAGLALAARLSENPDVNVGFLRLEGIFQYAGDQYTRCYFGRAIGNPDVDWMLYTVPQRAIHNRTIFQPRGKALGGSSAINFMSLSRATKDEYDGIGKPRMELDSLLPYFKKSENLTAPPPAIAEKYQIRPDPGFHGTDGPVRTSYPIWYPDLHEPFMETLDILGIPPNLDPQNGYNVGRYVAPTTVDPNTVTRSYSVTAYFEPNKDRPNLHVLTGAHVTKVLTSSQSGTVVATAVQFQHEGELFLGKAQREVILCAGSLQTPNFSSCLESAILKFYKKIPLRLLSTYRASVKTSDHPYLPVIREVTSDTQTYEILDDPGVLGEQATLYSTKKEGIFSSVHSGLAMVPLDRYVDGETRARLKQRLENMLEAQAGTALSKQLSLQNRWFDDPAYAQLELIHIPAWLPIGQPGELSPNPGTHYHSVITILPHPISRGSVHIASADPFTHPAIDPNYLSDPVDLEMMIHAVRFAQKIMMTGPLRGVIPRLLSLVQI